MSRLRIQSVLLFVVTSISMFAIGVLVAGQTADILNVVPIEVQVVATGIPGAGAIAQIGTFHLGGLGPHLADNIEQGQATGREFRTMPLWRVSDRPHFLHNGSATTLTDAIRAHGGQGAEAASAFERLSDADKAALLAFLGCI
jgi:cytochrome c peroxidase